MIKIVAIRIAKNEDVRKEQNETDTIEKCWMKVFQDDVVVENAYYMIGRSRKYFVVQLEIKEEEVDYGIDGEINQSQRYFR